MKSDVRKTHRSDATPKRRKTPLRPARPEDAQTSRKKISPTRLTTSNVKRGTPVKSTVSRAQSDLDTKNTRFPIHGKDRSQLKLNKTAPRREQSRDATDVCRQKLQEANKLIAKLRNEIASLEKENERLQEKISISSERRDDLVKSLRERLQNATRTSLGRNENVIAQNALRQAQSDQDEARGQVGRLKDALKRCRDECSKLKAQLNA